MSTGCLTWAGQSAGMWRESGRCQDEKWGWGVGWLEARKSERSWWLKGQKDNACWWRVSVRETNEQNSPSLPPPPPPPRPRASACVCDIRPQSGGGGRRAGWQRAAAGVGDSRRQSGGGGGSPGAQQLYVTHFSHKHRSHVYDPFVAFISRAGMKLIIWSFFRLTEQL